MSSIPVHNPRVPFLGQIPGGLRPSLMIRMRAKMTTRNGRCNINFIKSPLLESEQDIMLHISIRLDQQCMVRNTFQNRAWQQEERQGAFTIAYNTPFEITVLAEFERYKIAVNGVHVAEFAHRLPLHLVQYMVVKGDVAVEHIMLEQDIKTSPQVQLPMSQYGISTAQISFPAYQQHSIVSGNVSYPSAPPPNYSPYDHKRF